MHWYWKVSCCCFHLNCHAWIRFLLQNQILDGFIQWVTSLQGLSLAVISVMFQIKNRINKSVRLCRNSKIYKINVKTCFTCSFKFLLPHVYNLLFKVFLIEELKSYFKYLLWQVKPAQPCEALRLDWSQTHYLIWFTVILLLFNYITCMALII